MTACEVNFDAIVGPTHNYAGLAPGNLASAQHRGQPASPRAAALQGLAKMLAVRDLGLTQAVLPPPPRPDLNFLRRLGFAGPDRDLLAAAADHAPHLLAAVWSASAMWAANAATVCPTPDAADGRLHLTPANLIAAPHRALEAERTAAVLRAVFANPAHFMVHAPLPAAVGLGDEGAANHTRLSAAYGEPGVQLFVFGQPPGSTPAPGRHTALDRNNALDAPSLPRRFAPRQSPHASHAVARLHQLDPDRTVFAQQHPAAIDAGVFHHDVIGVGNRDLLLIHARALVDQPAALDRLAAAFARATGRTLRIAEVSADELSLADAVDTYLFNSQLVSPPGRGDVLVCPSQCEAHPRARAVLDRFQREGVLSDVRFADVRQSMQNGGGPACLRLRVELTADQLAAMHPGVLLTDELAHDLERIIERDYPETITPADLTDPALAAHCLTVSATLHTRLGLTA